MHKKARHKRSARPINTEPTKSPARQLLQAAHHWAGPPSDTFQLALLGPFTLRSRASRGRSLPKKAQALLAYLALHAGRSVPREQLATLLWGHTGTEQARRSLRQCLMSVRAALGPSTDILVTNGNGILLAESEQIDVQRFETLSPSTDPEDLEMASELYRDEFLAGLHVASEPFAEWALVERRRLASINSDVLYRLAQAYADSGEVGRAIATAQRLTAFDPLREDAHRLVMRLLAKAGKRSAALTQHALCVDTLRRELGIAPEPATSELAESIRKGLTASGPSTSAVAQSVLAVPDKPSIVVLPFTNLSGNPDQDYFADGMMEDITIALGRLSWLFVIAGGSAQTYKGRSVDPRQVGAELGVRYVLRGSVRRSESRVRIVIQLIDALQGSHLWADRFEGELENVFDIQDRVTAQVVGMIAPALHAAEIERARRKATGNLTAYDLYLRAVPLFRSSFPDNKQALRLLAKAVELDPLYGAAYGFAARCYQFQRLFGWVHPSDPVLKEGIRLAHRAAETGNNDSEALWMAGLALVQLAGEVDYGLSLIEKSLSFNPNSANAWVASCFVRAYLNDAEAAMEDFGRAQRLNPRDAMHHVQWFAAAIAHFAAARYEEAADAADRALKERPNYPPALRLKVSMCGLLGRSEEARHAVQRLIAVNPDVSVSWLKLYWEPYWRRNPRALEVYLRGLRSTGLPEGDQR